MKQAIVVVSFGTTHRDTREKNIDAIEQAVGRAFPGWEIRRAFTSGMVIRQLAARDHMAVDTVPQALERLAAEGYEQVVLQPTHVIHGEEYEDILTDMAAFAGHFAALAVGRPLLSATDDYRRLARLLSHAFPPRPDTVVCLMGHGTRHHADSAYAALDYHCKALDRPDIFIGTVEGYPDLAQVLELVNLCSPKRAVLAPLMVVAGDHAQGDLAGDGDSWRSAFAAAGYDTQCILKGLGEYPEALDIYLDHVKETIKHMEESQ